MDQRPIKTEPLDREMGSGVQFDSMDQPQTTTTSIWQNVEVEHKSKSCEIEMFDGITPDELTKETERKSLTQCDITFPQTDFTIHPIKEERKEQDALPDVVITDPLQVLGTETSADGPFPVALFKSAVWSNSKTSPSNVCEQTAISASRENLCSSSTDLGFVNVRVPASEKLFNSLLCDKDDLTKHGRTNTGEKPYKCSLCPYSTGRTSHLNEHQRIHTGEKPFKCPVCPYRASRKGHIKTHERTHTSEKPFKCSVCPYRSSWKGAIKTHERTHTGDKPFKCALCSYSTAWSGHMKVHDRTHTREKPFQCPLCPSSFAKNEDLTKHGRIHTGEKPFSCSLCPYTTARSGSLARHVRTHIGERPFKCTLCSYTTTRKNCLTIHERRHAGEKT